MHSLISYDTLYCQFTSCFDSKEFESGGLYALKRSIPLLSLVQEVGQIRLKKI